MRIACGLSYEGTLYAGWQWQKNAITIQEEVEQAISQVAMHSVRVTCAGRTDRGVHAKEQVIHFDTDCERETSVWKAAVNYYLPPDIRILWVQITDNHFHARFSAEKRTYHYMIYQGEMPWFRHYSWMTTRHLKLAAMQEASLDLAGEHDFSALRSAHCQASSPVRRISQLTLTQKENWIQLKITANAFLYHMVRNIIGVLVDVGQEKRAANSIPDLLKSRDRRNAGITAPPQGLYLVSIHYPKEFQLPTMEREDSSDLMNLS